MNIHNFFYNDDNKIINIEFSLQNDDDNIYRTLELTYDDVEYYSPTLIYENEMKFIDNSFIIELLEEYFKENDYPNEKLL